MADPGTPLLKNNRERLPLTKVPDKGLLFIIGENMNIKEIRKRADFYQSNFLEKHPVSNRIIPHLISSTSKMYKKAVNFEDSINLF